LWSRFDILYTVALVVQLVVITDMNHQRRFVVRYRNCDVDRIPSSAALDDDWEQDHVLGWHPPMVPPLIETFMRVRDELATRAGHPLRRAIAHRGVRALLVVELQHVTAMQPHGGFLQGGSMCVCVLCGWFTESMCLGGSANFLVRWVVVRV
jgi:hypothetical protein